MPAVPANNNNNNKKNAPTTRNSTNEDTGSRLVYLLLGNLKWINLVSNGREPDCARKKSNSIQFPPLKTHVFCHITTDVYIRHYVFSVKIKNLYTKIVLKTNKTYVQLQIRQTQAKR